MGDPHVPQSTTSLNWSPQQSRALRDVADWLADPGAPQVYRLFGYAGTGKTTLARHLAADVRGAVLFAAFTGKAAAVLRDKGCAGARTLHSILYSAQEKSRHKLRELERQLAVYPPAAHKSDVVKELLAEIRAERRRLNTPHWELRNREESALHGAALLVCDEVSMVDSRLGRDILSFGVKVLVLGDPAQLPPVRGAGFFTESRPNALLTEVHRQALESPILRWATALRNGQPLPAHGRAEGPDGEFAQKLRKADVGLDWLAAEGGQLLTGKNATRRKLNAECRLRLGYEGLYPRQGDRLVLLKNDAQLDVFNGTVGYAAADAEELPDDTDALAGALQVGDRVIPDVTLDRRPFDIYARPELEDEPDPRGPWSRPYPADYGYCLTVHKAQGSQWDAVTVLDDGFAKREPLDRRRWMYTAVTRAARRLTVVQG